MHASSSRCNKMIKDRRPFLSKIETSRVDILQIGKKKE